MYDQGYVDSSPFVRGEDKGLLTYYCLLFIIIILLFLPENAKNRVV